MKLLRFGAVGAEKPGILDNNDQIRDLSGIIDDVSGRNLGDETIARVAKLDLTSLPVVDESTRIGPCVGNVGKFICIGLNYADHAAESGMELPQEPVIFFKATSAIMGPNDNVEIPRNSFKTDWEVELGVVIGKHTKYITKEEAINHVAGYCIINDLSEREFQLHRSGQWVKGKSADTFGPIGPWLVTRDEISDPQKPELYLKAGDTIELSIDGLGVQYQDVSSA